MRASVFASYRASRSLSSFSNSGNRRRRSLHRLRIEREQPAIGERFHRSGPRRSVENRKLAEKIAFAIKGEIALLAVHAGKGARPAFLEHEHRPGLIALANDQSALLHFHAARDSRSRCASAGAGSSSEIAELIKETLERAAAAGHLDVMLQVGNLFGQLRGNRFDRCAARRPRCCNAPKRCAVRHPPARLRRNCRPA